MIDELTMRTGKAVDDFINWIRGRKGGGELSRRANSSFSFRVKTESKHEGKAVCPNCGFDSPITLSGECTFCGKSLFCKEPSTQQEASPIIAESVEAAPEESESLIDWYNKQGWTKPEVPIEEPSTPTPIPTTQSESEVEAPEETKPIEKSTTKEEKTTPTPTDEEIENMIMGYVKTNYIGNLGGITEALKPHLAPSFASPKFKIQRIMKRTEKEGKIEHRDAPSFSAPFIRYYALTKRNWGGNVGIEHVAMTKELLDLLNTMNLPVKVEASSITGFPAFFDVILDSWGIIEIETGLKDHLMKSTKDATQMVDEKIERMKSKGLSYMVFLAAKKDVANKIREATKDVRNARVFTMREFPKEFLDFFNSTFKK